MNAIETLYRNTGFVTEDGYVKVRDGLWVKSGLYQEQKWHDVDDYTIPTEEELHEIYLKLQELIQIQESCGLDSLRQILASNYSWVWSSSEYNANIAWTRRMSDGYQANPSETVVSWVIPIRRSL